MGAVADASVASNALCTAGADKECKTATDSCCVGYAVSGGTTLTAVDPALSYCHAAVTADQTAVDPNVTATRFGKATCKGRTAGAASLAATAAAATALYAMC